MLCVSMKGAWKPSALFGVRYEEDVDVVCFTGFSMRKLLIAGRE